MDLELNGSLIVGRFQPLHYGHKALIQHILDEGRTAVIALRDTPKDKDNPYTLSQRFEMIRSAFPKMEDQERIYVCVIGDIDEIVHGRNPGWSVREIDLDDETKNMSATAIRGGHIVWVTGQSGAGKTTLAHGLKEKYLPSAIILDGNEMRLTISESNDFSMLGRLDHNRRVARLATLLRDQGHIVIVSVIAPTFDIRREVDRLARPIWIYLTRASKRALLEGWPYEPPTGKDHFRIDNKSDIAQPLLTLEKAWQYLRSEIT